jgi:hypothetical protein
MYLEVHTESSRLFFASMIDFNSCCCMMCAVASQGHKSEPMNFQLLIDSIPALIPTTPPDGYLDFFNQIWLGVRWRLVGGSAGLEVDGRDSP